MRVLVVVCLFALLFGGIAGVIGYLVAGGDPGWSPLVAGVLGSLITIAFSFYVVKRRV
jgi:hypothetical protein